MSGNHRAVREAGKARVAVAGALTAGTLLLAPVGAAVVAAPAGIAYAGPNIVKAPVVHKQIIRLPFVKIEIKTVKGQPPKIKVVPFPGLHLKPPTKPVKEK
jgi:hypothetical protein